jgi:hypothetical protein
MSKAVVDAAVEAEVEAEVGHNGGGGGHDLEQSPHQQQTNYHSILITSIMIYHE